MMACMSEPEVAAPPTDDLPGRAGGAARARADRSPGRDGAGTAEPRPTAPPATQVVTIAFEPRLFRRTMITALLIVGAGLLALWAFSVTSHFLFLLLLAWLFAIAMEPGIRWFMRRGMRRGSATAIVGSSVLVASLVFVAVFGDLFFTQLVDLVKAVPDALTKGIDWVNRTFHANLDPNAIEDKLHANTGEIASAAGKLAGGILGIVGSLVSLLFDLFTVVVFGFYFASDSPRIQRGIASWMRPSAQRVFVTVWDIAVEKTGGYVVSKVVLAALSTLFHGIFFWAIGVPFWLPFAIFVGVTAQFIPVIGTYIGIVVPVLFTVFGSPWKALFIVGFAAVYQQIETYVFTPRVSKRTMDVNQAIALGAVFLGAAIWGPIGAIIGIPLAAAAVAVADTYRHRYELVVDLGDETEAETGAADPSKA